MGKRKFKGKDLHLFPKDYCIIDIETNGLTTNDEIIEVAAVKVINKKIISEYSSLIKPENNKINDFIRDLTGISNDMIQTAPSFSKEVINFDNFIQDQILIGHNVNFDINFLYDSYEKYYNKHLSNNFVDMLELVKENFPDYPNYKLQTVIKKLGIKKNQEHRALSDCLDTYNCFEKIREITSIDRNQLSLF